MNKLEESALRSITFKYFSIVEDLIKHFPRDADNDTGTRLRELENLNAEYLRFCQNHNNHVVECLNKANDK